MVQQKWAHLLIQYPYPVLAKSNVKPANYVTGYYAVPVVATTADAVENRRHNGTLFYTIPDLRPAQYSLDCVRAPVGHARLSRTCTITHIHQHASFSAPERARLWILHASMGMKHAAREHNTELGKHSREHRLPQATNEGVAPNAIWPRNLSRPPTRSGVLSTRADDPCTHHAAL